DRGDADGLLDEIDVDPLHLERCEGERRFLRSRSPEREVGEPDETVLHSSRKRTFRGVDLVSSAKEKLALLDTKLGRILDERLDRGELDTSNRQLSLRMKRVDRQIARPLERRVWIHPRGERISAVRARLGAEPGDRDVDRRERRLELGCAAR